MKTAPSRRGTDAPHFKYRGGKAILRRAIVRWAQLRGRVYIEPFAGRGNVFFLMERLASFQRWVLNDLATLPFFTQILRYGGEPLPRLTKEEALGEVETPRFILMEPVLTRCGGLVSGDTVVGVRKENLLEFRRRLLDVKIALQKAEIQGRDGVDLLEEFSQDQSAFLYLDPPYLGAKVGIYDASSVGWTRLFQLLKRSRAQWLLSHYNHKVVLRELGEPLTTIKGVYVSPIPGISRRVEECLWANYSLKKPNIVDFGDVSRPVVQRSLDLLRLYGAISWSQWQRLVPKHWKPATVRTQFRALGLFPQHYFDGEVVSIIGENEACQRQKPTG